MHFITSPFKKKLVTPVLILVTWLNPKIPATMIQIRHLLRMGRFARLRKPQDLNEKILWMTLYTDTKEWSRLADKYEVRNFVRECGLEDILVKQYGLYNSMAEVSFDDLPNSFILKPTHGSGDVVVVKDKSKVNIEAIRTKIQKGLDEYICTSAAELHYTRIPHRVIAEELLINDPVSEKYSSTLIDYKIWCFNGKAQFIWVCMNRFVKNKDGAEVMTYDREWNAHPEYCRETPDFSLAEPMPKPNDYEHMLEVAEKLAEKFPIVRVDLYNLNGKLYFGEMTFTSYGAIMDFYSNEFLKLAGSMIDLSNVDRVR